MDELSTNQPNNVGGDLETNVDTEHLSEAVKTEQAQTFDGIEQENSLEKIVEEIIEEQNTLRKSNEELLTKNHELETSLQQLQEEPNIAFGFSIVALILSILAIATFVILRNKLMVREKRLDRELYVEDKSSHKKISCIEKISALNQELQKLNSIKNELYFEDKPFGKKVSCREKISELNQEVQRLNLIIAEYEVKTIHEQGTVVDKSAISASRDSPNELYNSTLSQTFPEANINFTDDFNALMSIKDSTIFSKELNTFLIRYKVSAFSCSNSQELIQDSNITPIFKEISVDDRADYWAYENDNGYLVVPSPYVQNYNDSVNIGRAFGKVFKSNFMFGGYFTNIQVEKPAFFQKNGLQWILKSQGKLVLR